MMESNRLNNELSYTEKTLQSGVIKMVKEQYWLYPLPLGTVLTLQVND